MLQRERRCNLATAIQTRKEPYRDRIELLQVTLDIKVALLQTNNRSLMISRMQAVADDVFKALADPTRPERAVLVVPTSAAVHLVCSAFGSDTDFSQRPNLRAIA